MYRVFKKVKKHFLKRFDVCLHQTILSTTHLKNFYYIFQRFLEQNCHYNDAIGKFYK